MMKFTIVSVGRMKKGPERDLCDLYIKRLKWSFTLEEVEEKNHLGPNEMKKKEAEFLMEKVPEGALLIAMDQNGDILSSVEFAGKISDWQNQNIRNLAFVIGGSNGLDITILNKADKKIALGKMTWPHMLARVMLLEQLYRAQSILGKHPYHK